MPPDGRFEDIEGARMHFVDSAHRDASHRDRPALVLIHGLGGNLRNMTHSLTERLDAEFRTVAVDRIGMGYSTRPGGGEGGGTLAEHAAAIASLIGRLGLGRPVLVGHSMGGAVALRLAADRPDIVAGAVLVAPLCGVVTDVPPAFRALDIRSVHARRAVARTLAVPFGILRGERTLATVFHPDPVPDDFATRGGGRLGLRPAAFLSTSTDLHHLHAAAADEPLRRDELRVPIAIIHGTSDAILDHREHAVAAGERLGAEVRLLDGRGHMIPITAPDEVAEFVAAKAGQWRSEADPATPADAVRPETDRRVSCS